MYTNVLLLGLHHPNAFLPHCPHDAEYVDVVADENLLEDAIEGDEGAAAPDAGATVHDYGPLIGLHAFPERADETGESLRR